MVNAVTESKLQLAAGLLAGLFSPFLNGWASDISARYCDASPAIQHRTVIRVPDELLLPSVRQAVLEGISTANKGRWYLEDENGPVVYAGTTVRSHYLQLAIIYDFREINSIVCTSDNLKQTETRIHRKVPGWKGRVDTAIRQALADELRVAIDKGPAAAAYSNLEEVRHWRATMELDYNDTTGEGVISVEASGKAARNWMLDRIGEIAATKNVMLQTGKSPKPGNYILLDEVSSKGRYTIGFEVVY